MLVRIRTLTIEGSNQDILIGALSMAQAREIFTSDTKTRGDMVATALNNALTNGDRPWTVERVQAEMDDHTFKRLADEILDLCGLKEKVEGETKAASAS